MGHQPHQDQPQDHPLAHTKTQTVVAAKPMKPPSKSLASPDHSAHQSADSSSLAQPTHPEPPRENASSKPLDRKSHRNAHSSAHHRPMTPNAKELAFAHTPHNSSPRNNHIYLSF